MTYETGCLYHDEYWVIFNQRFLDGQRLRGSYKDDIKLVCEAWFYILFWRKGKAWRKTPVDWLSGLLIIRAYDLFRVGDINEKTIEPHLGRFVPRGNVSNSHTFCCKRTQQLSLVKNTMVSPSRKDDQKYLPVDSPSSHSLTRTRTPAWACASHEDVSAISDTIMRCCTIPLNSCFITRTISPSASFTFRDTASTILRASEARMMYSPSPEIDRSDQLTYIQFKWKLAYLPETLHATPVFLPGVVIA